jgi:hypothetical protein
MIGKATGGWLRQGREQPTLFGGILGTIPTALSLSRRNYRPKPVPDFRKSVTISTNWTWFAWLERLLWPSG